MQVFSFGVGEEFLIVLPSCKKALLNKAESIRTNLDYTLQDGLGNDFLGEQNKSEKVNF